ncbi:NACHT, LRR and PYD domains-containing 14-like [Paramuricea clavata]|uniref:NACHT, LRR and PYD domains-containing 14-like n=1 Tax=Paramuricea clavata TaxID=317549 RepID=A0A7D9D712_PARCT|nr:NACHT, LRR and PYD domains-containing 14-like [Paramuricea clavata]
MQRHEIYDVYMAVPSTSLCLEKIKDLFYPNEDTKSIVPRRILVIGRPGIGKTVLTQKIIRDWANGIDQYYCDKIAFVFKFRWFNMDELTSLSLKTFLRIGTGNLSEESFESIYEEITREPQKAIFIFDGLDEFNGNPNSCLDQSQIIRNDPNTCMSGINLFTKIIFGSCLQGATVLVTSRPTTDNFYSKLDFDRNVEILGFTSKKIEEYVSRFCDNNNRSDFIPNIWNHINSSPELLNLCYIPANCFIVCVTLSGCFSDPGNDTGALPTTLTELYQTAVDHFEKHHHRNAHGNSIPEETLKKLQLISFRGMENGQLIFNQELFDAQMKKSGLVNILSNPFFPVQAQFCFIHLTIQEYLAARHVTETLAPVDIKKFIFDHVRRSKWHLVLQFMAELLGKKMKMFDREYMDCVLVFVEGFEEMDNAIRLNYNHVFVMKCLKEVDDENIAKDMCKTTAIKDVVKLYTDLDDNISPSDWAAVTFVCKHMDNLASFNLRSMGSDCLQEILKLLQKKCIHQLWLRMLDRSRDVDVEHVFSALMNMECTVSHTHTNLTWLTLNNFCMSDKVLSKIRLFLKNGHGSHLEILNLSANKLGPSGIYKLCEVLNNNHFTELAYLDLSGNPVGDEGASVLCNTLIKGPRKLTKLKLFGCSLTGRCIPSFVKTLQDEHCKLTYLSLGGNGIGDDGVRSLCENALNKEHCKLTELHLGSCSLTDRCISNLCQALQDERCKLNVLSLSHNNIGNEGVCVLFEDALMKEHCKLTKLYLDKCLLTDQCIPTLCKALQDERCKLTNWIVENNNIGDEGVCALFEDVLTNEHCKLTELNLNECLLTDKCIPILCKTLQDERCGLTRVCLNLNRFTENGKKILVDLQKYSECKAIIQM